MWFKLAGATFTNNLGTMESISKSYMMDYSGLTGLQAAPGSVSYADDATPDATITFTVKSGYVFKSGSTVTASGGASKTYTASADIAAGSSFTMALTGINNKVIFTGAAELVSGGGSSSGGGGSEGDTTTYTFTVNPTPTSATVTLSATGYTTVTGTGSKSITVASGTTVSWSVSASGYTTRTGTQTISDGNKTENIILSAISDGGDRVYTIGETLKFNDMPEVASTFISDSYYKATDSGNPGSKLTIETRSGYKAWKNIRIYAGQSYALNPDARAICLYDADENAFAGFNLKNTYSDGIIPASVVTQDGWMSVTVTSSTSDDSCTIRRVS